MTGTYRRGGRVRRDGSSRLRPSIFLARRGRCRGTGLKRFVQALFRYGDNGEPFWGEVPVKAERSMDGLILHDHKRCCIYERARPVGSTARKIKSHVKLVCCWGMRVRIAAFGVADPPHSGMWSRQGHSGSSWNRTGSWDRPAGGSRNRLRDKSGDRSGGVLRNTWRARLASTKLAFPRCARPRMQ